MKDMLIGYITALINNQDRKIESLKENKVDEITIENFNSFKGILEDLLIFTEDSSEIEICSLKEEATMLRKRVQELEESCEDMCEIEQNLHNQIANLKSDEVDKCSICGNSIFTGETYYSFNGEIVCTKCIHKYTGYFKKEGAGNDQQGKVHDVCQKKNYREKQ